MFPAHLTSISIAQLLGMVSLAIIVTNGVVTFGKQIIGVWLAAPSQQPAYKAAVQGLAILAGVCSTIYLTATYYGPLTPQLCALAGPFGYAIGLAAMGNYEMLTALIKSVEGMVVTPSAVPGGSLPELAPAASPPVGPSPMDPAVPPA